MVNWSWEKLEKEKLERDRFPSSMHQEEEVVVVVKSEKGKARVSPNHLNLIFVNQYGTAKR